MARQNTVLLNVSGGEVTPEVYGRLDLPAYARGYQRVQNREVLPQGGSRFRNGFTNVHNTRGLQAGRLVDFSFNEVDTYTIELTNKYMRFYRDFGTVLNSTSLNISAITKANPCVITSASHGLSNGQEIYLSGIAGMVELNNQYFLIAGVTTNTFQLQDIYGNPIDSTAFLAYTSGGTIQTPYEIPTPYLLADLNDLHLRQSADTIYITNQSYAPYKLTRTGNTAWTLNFFTRTQDPFMQQVVSAASNANPGVFTVADTSMLALGDEVYFDGFAGGTWNQLSTNRYFVNTIPGSTTFTIKTEVGGVAVDTTGFGTYTGSSAIVIPTKLCPATSAFISDSRLMYANWQDGPDHLAGSQTPDPTTGQAQFDNFTTGANDNDAFLFTLSSVFDQQDAIQWMTVNSQAVVIGCASSIRTMTGTGGAPNPITPSSIYVAPINNVGAAPVQPYSNGQVVYYVDQTTLRIASFVFSIQTFNYTTVNQNLIANQLSTSPFIVIAQQRREANLLWTLRADGVLLGLTFDEIESVYGWHRHYFGGNSVINNVAFKRANVLSISVEPRLNEDAVLWAIVERQLANGNTYRSVEYWNPFIKFVDPYDFYSGYGDDAQATDEAAFANATYEQVKQSIHLDGAISYDGSTLSSATMTPSATGPVGTTITLTAGSNFFDATMVGKEIWKAYDIQGNGGGRAKITAYTSPTQVSATVEVAFDTTAAIFSDSWFLTTGMIYGLIHLAGEQIDLQTDGAPYGTVTVGSDGSVALNSQSSVVHSGYKYLGMLASMNIDAGGQRGSAQAKKRKIRQIIPRFLNTIGARVGTDKWSTTPLVFKDQDQVTDRPTNLYSDVLEITPDDSWSRLTKQVVLIQDIPSPQTVLSLDVAVETSDD